MTHAPRPGSIVARAISALTARGAMPRRELADAIGIDVKNLSGNLATAISEGLIVRTIVSNKPWLALPEALPIAAPSAPAEPARPQRKFSAALWSDGTMALLNCENAAGEFTSVELTAEQVEQVRALLAGIPNG